MQTKKTYMNVLSLPTLQRVSLRAVLFLSLICAASAIGQTKATKASSSARQQADDGTAAFKEWISRYDATSASAQRSQMSSEGLALAKQRHAAMLELIKTDPAAVRALAIAPNVRKQLPSAVANEVENYVSGMGDLSVLIFCPGPKNPVPAPMQRKVTLNGKTYQAYVSGRRSGQLSKTGIPLSGIVLDGVLALDESPVRELAADETPTSPVNAAGYSAGPSISAAQTIV